VAPGSGAAPTHGSTDGGSPGLGSPGALVHQTRRGKRQNREGMTPNSPRQSVQSGKWQFRLAVTAFPFASSAPLRSSDGYEERNGIAVLRWCSPT
jgi:hypothetical protein